MSKEAMKLALEALDIVKIHFTQNRHVNDAITALREALAKPDFWEGYEPEPVKPAQCKYPKCSYPCTDLPDCRDAEQPAQQEPVAFLDWYDNAHWGNEDFKAGCWRAWDAALAQRTWQGLTNDEVNNLAAGCHLGNSVQDAIYKAVAKLKEKNT